MHDLHLSANYGIFILNNVLIMTPAFYHAEALISISNRKLLLFLHKIRVA
jgi:hypothetical protein